MKAIIGRVVVWVPFIILAFLYSDLWAQHQKPLRSARIFFKGKSPVLSSKAKDYLMKMVKSWQKEEGLKVFVEGHSNNWKKGVDPCVLGEKRAEAVKEFLTSKGSKSFKFEIVSFCDDKLLEQKKDKGNTRNDRVEVFLTPFKSSKRKPITLFFQGKGAKISKQAKDKLLKLADFLKKSRVTNIIIEGHTDSSQSNQKNLEYGYNRAKAVNRFLLKNGVYDDAISIISYGEEKPLKHTTANNALKYNNRVRIVFE